LVTRGSTKKKVTAVKPSRIGRVQFSSYHAPEAGRQLKIPAAEQGSTIQALTAEALNMLFAKYGKQTVATLDASVQRGSNFWCSWSRPA
jgi:hypothetical protein